MLDFISHISNSINDTLSSLSYFKSEMTLILGILLLILGDLFFSKKYPQLSFALSIITVLIVLLQGLSHLHLKPQTLFGGMLVLDHLAVLFKILFCFVSLLFILFIRLNKSLHSHSKGLGDLYSILIAVHLGLNLMAMSSNLLMLFIALEMVSLGSYLMVAYISKDERPIEASLKYALFGSVASAIMLYGMSLLYGFSGSLYLNSPEFISGLKSVSEIPLILSLTFVFVGIAFKLSAFPLHFWAPDVYQGAPNPITAFLSTGPKIAGFAILIKFLVLLQDIGTNLNSIYLFLALIAIASMLIGNFAAIWQNNSKRMLAYSSIGHTGFMFMALFTLPGQGYKSLIFYMFIYIIMNMAAFLILDEIEDNTSTQNISEYASLGKKLSLLMFSFVIVLVSLTGLPPTAGFTAKFLVFSTVLENYKNTGSIVTLIMIILAAISTVISLFYYFKIPLNAYLRDADTEDNQFKLSTKTYFSAFLAFLLILFIVFPSIIEQIL